MNIIIKLSSGQRYMYLQKQQYSYADPLYIKKTKSESDIILKYCISGLSHHKHNLLTVSTPCNFTTLFSLFLV